MSSEREFLEDKMKKKKTALDPLLAKYYSEGNEKDRLSTHQIERDRTLRILQKMLPAPPAVILDVGGGAGSYAFPLSERGYEVHLIDPVAVHIEQAKEYSKQHQLPLKSFSVGDARLIEREDCSSDVVLFLGPLYHLIEASDRMKALQEAFRVLKPGGMLFAAAISRFASLMDSFYKGEIVYSRLENIDQDIKTGVHRKLVGLNSHVTEDMTFAYLHRPWELKKELEQCGFGEVSVRAIEGPVWHKTTIQELQNDQEGWQELLGLLEKIELEETIIGASAHIMGVGIKPKG